MDRVKYSHPEYSDRQIDGLMRYFRFDTYLEFVDFLKKYKTEERESEEELTKF